MTTITIINSIGQRFKNNYRIMKIICDEFPIPCFPFKDREKLQLMVKDWQRRSAGGLFNSCVGAFDGYLLRISKSCVHADKVTNPQKYYCRKGFYSVNCQVCCDSHRRASDLDVIITPRRLSGCDSLQAIVHVSSCGTWTTTR